MNPIQEVYERFTHLDKVLSAEPVITGDEQDWQRQMIFDLWTAIKASQEKGGAISAAS